MLSRGDGWKYGDAFLYSTEHENHKRYSNPPLKVLLLFVLVLSISTIIPIGISSARKTDLFRIYKLEDTKDLIVLNFDYTLKDVYFKAQQNFIRRLL